MILLHINTICSFSIFHNMCKKLEKCRLQNVGEVDYGTQAALHSPHIKYCAHFKGRNPVKNTPLHYFNNMK